MDRILQKWRYYLFVQPPLMLLLISLSMSGTIFTDLLVYRTCLVTLKLNETECLIFHNNSTSKEAFKINSLAQPYVANIIMGKSFIESITPSLLMLFLGPWSDKYGRKPLMLSGYMSVSLTYILLSVMANWDIVPWYFLIAYIPVALFGGLSVLLLASTCYITDIIDDKERAWHFAFLQTLISLSLLIGLLSGPAIFDACGYTAVFSVATVLCILATLYILLFVPETVQSQTSGICNIFDLTLIKDLIDTCVRKRHGFNRSLVWSCVACLSFLLIVFEGYLSIGYLFASARLGWTMQQYSVYNAADIVVQALGTIIGIKVMRKYAGFPETVIAIISIISSFGSALIRAFTWLSWHMYLSMVLGMFGDISRPMIRAILSKAVPVQDAGKIFSVAMTLETLLPFAADSLYTFLYSHYMPPLYPLPVWFLSTVFYVITIVILIYIQIQVIKNITVSYIPITEDSNDSLISYQEDTSTNVPAQNKSND
ncbi:PREDICTED: proton-coupled folate transporter-like isoform X1 [Acromyrmex echinatior]|uniref:Proton-coupled folate transporter n=1 Tax=Acromyrmex echinatior TaxID=103372 RepID=F4W8G3_ACREC|nr:PREDICTED: proton-coupled folate transporter-like isoform X1 [Acromyrmex echinatior]XP_011068312.1 PREDICTED: proton-coupled folate transporter-like isoform X1 [Acromyrmex echinatior]EGI69454.1 Proton-coupled folate transporter [Acromyrmex echinatior]